MKDSRASDSFSPLTYAIRYIGCIPIRVSIKTLDFNTRTIIARECIHRVCEDAKLKVPSVRPAAKEVSAYIDEISDLRYAMTSVHVTISLESLVVEEFHTGSVLFRHPLGSVSFSSAGDNEMLDFVSYVAKTDDYNRMCYVFQCSNGVSRDFISSMGQAFRLAYQGFNENNFTPGRNLTCRPKLQTTNIFPSKQSLTTVNGAEESRCSQLPETNFFDLFTDGLSDSQNDVKVHQNPWPPRFPSGDRNSNAASLKYSSQPSRFPAADSNSKQTSQHISSIAEISSKNLNYLPVSHPLEPVGEPWYLGCLSRQIAESLLQYDGDFLVRASSQQPGQFVLSGLQDGKRRHLLLVNPEGQVRTRDRIFTNIQNLIDYHLRSGIPIRSADSELKLAFPVSLK